MKKIPTEYIDRVFDTMEQADQHVFQVLTKRSSLMRNYVNARYAGCSRAPSNIWLGVSVESAKVLGRLAHLSQIRAAIRFVSFEPLLDCIGKVNLTGVNWVIVGGESGPRARPMEPFWVRDLRDQCIDQDVAFFFKQWGGKTPKAKGNMIDGKKWLEFPINESRLGLLPA